jgi:hypothetical protein
MSTDPVVITPERFRDPQQLNPYAYVRNNPLKFVDPTGEILTGSGDIDQIMVEICKMIGVDSGCNKRINYDENSNTLTVDLTGIDLQKNEGAALLNDLTGSSRNYDLYMGYQGYKSRMDNAIPTLAGPKTFKNLMENNDWEPDERYRNGKTEWDFPPIGIDDQIAIEPSFRRTSLTNLQPATLDSIVFHELAEAYAKIDGGMKYDQAHQEAIKREEKYRDQKPFLKDTNPGSGPGDCTNVIIRK